MRGEGRVFAPVPFNNEALLDVKNCIFAGCIGRQKGELPRVAGIRNVRGRSVLEESGCVDVDFYGKDNAGVEKNI